MKFTTFILCLFFALGLQAQQGLYLDAAYVQAFNSRDITIDGESIEDQSSFGYRAHLFYNYSLEKLEIRLGAGIKQLYFSGRREELEFSGETAKLDVFLGGFYKAGEKWKLGVQLGMENNRDFDDFRAQTSDLFRYTLQLEANYAITKSIFVALGYSKALAPYSDFYLLSNPSDQIHLGLNYHLPWP